MGIAGLCAGLVVTAGCARGGSGNDELTESIPLIDGINACDEVFAAGKAIDTATFGQVCSQGEEMVVARPVRLECGDGRVLTWNDFAWGYEGQEMTLRETGDPVAGQAAEEALPFDEAVSCLGNTTAAADAVG